MATKLVRDIDWASYGIDDPAYTELEWDANAFRHAVGDHPCTLLVDERTGGGRLQFQWRIGVSVTPEQVKRLIADVFTHPSYAKYPFYADAFGHERIYQLPEIDG
jgi:hypothetical protein